jgi:hypothetical protein
MRTLDYKYNQRADGSMSFRLQLPQGRERSSFRACADGQFGGVIKAYRDWKISGDTGWLRSIWDSIKRSIEFAWAKTNEDCWDADKDGVLEGRQHHTLDMELFGPSSWLTGFYLAALKAGAEIADYLGEHNTSKRYMELYENGRAWVDSNLFNGEYFYQLIDLSDFSIIERYSEGGTLTGSSTADAYWQAEVKEIKYQIGEGCGVDQIVAQWHADICGLGDVFDREKSKKALKSIYSYNYKPSMRGHFNPCRLYSLNDEAGVVICDWPEGKYKPAVPVPYAEETMNGFEYQAACHMIRRGFVKEGLEIVESIRRRYDGERRNPWNEFECGSNYARSMASYDLLLAFSGFEFDMVTGMIGFDPIGIDTFDEYSSFWSLDSGWGSVKINRSCVEVSVLYGSLRICRFKLPFITGKPISYVKLGSRNINFGFNQGIFEFGDFIELSSTDEKLCIMFHS